MLNAASTFGEKRNKGFFILHFIFKMEKFFNIDFGGFNFKSTF